MTRFEDEEPSSTGSQMVEIVVDNLGMKYVSREKKADICLREVQPFLHVERLKSNNRTNMTDVCSFKKRNDIDQSIHVLLASCKRRSCNEWSQTVHF